MSNSYPKELRQARIFVAGHGGLLGSALVRCLDKYEFSAVITKDREELNLEDQSAVDEFFKHKKPTYVFLAAARVGGILANRNHPADFILSNLKIQTNVIESALKWGAVKLVNFGSSCVYPKHSFSITENLLLNGPLEKTNRSYAIAKIAGIELCRAITEQHKRSFISLMPCNLYGPNDNYSPTNSHVIPGIIWKINAAKLMNREEVTLWGSGNPKREFMHADDLAEAALLCLKSYNSNEPINVGSGGEVTIKELADLIKQVIEYKGTIKWDVTLPDGVQRKLLDSYKIRALGWEPKWDLKKGIKDVYENHCSLFKC